MPRPARTAHPLSAGDLLTERQASELLQVHRDTMRRWRREGTGPQWVDLAPHRSRPVVRYDARALARWVQS